MSLSLAELALITGGTDKIIARKECQSFCKKNDHFGVCILEET